MKKRKTIDISNNKFVNISDISFIKYVVFFLNSSTKRTDDKHKTFGLLSFINVILEIRCGVPATSGGLQVRLVGGEVFRATAFFSCPAGKCLNGDKQRKCQADGHWSGSQPSCLSKLLSFMLVSLFC